MGDGDVMTHDEGAERDAQQVQMHKAGPRGAALRGAVSPGKRSRGVGNRSYAVCARRTARIPMGR